MKHNRGQWISNLGFVLATAGSAIGLGNIWKFPGKVGLYGGGAFILTYILIVILIGLPIRLAEFAIGRAAQRNVVGAFHVLNRKWSFVGGIGILNLFVIMSYYCVVGGWVLKYVIAYLTDADFYTGTVTYQEYFSGFISKPVEPLVWGLVFLILCIVIIVKGVSDGIEKVSKKLMPLFFVLLIACVVRSFTLPGAKEGISFMFRVDWSSFNTDTLVGALGQAFFSISVGMGILVTYGSYAAKEGGMIKSAMWICGLDTLAALLSASAIIPMVILTLGQDGLTMGGGFAFMALPNVFDSLPGGRIFGLIFFILLFLAALTSALSVLETCVAFMIEEWNMSRRRATVIFSIPMAVLSIGYSLSQSAARNINLPWFDLSSGIQMLPMNAVMEKFTDNLMIPLGALGFCLFVGWSWGTEKAWKEICPDGNVPAFFRHAWSFIIRFLAPAVILMILYFTLGKGQGLS